MIVVAIDPGSEQSGWVEYDPAARRVLNAAVESNDSLIGHLRCTAYLAQQGRPQHQLCIETMRSYAVRRPGGGAAHFPQQLVDTCVWEGRFVEAWNPAPWARVTRREVKLHLLGRSNGNDAQVREALLELVGPKGKKADPGPTFGVSSHAWAALAVAYTWAETIWERA